MGFLRSLRRRVDVRISAIDNAVTQYNKFIMINTAPKEIPMMMFLFRYNNATLDSKSELRFAHYMITDFKIETVVGFILANLDIEMLYSPEWAKYYLDTCGMVVKELNKQSIASSFSDAEQFAIRWSTTIKPLRD